MDYFCCARCGHDKPTQSNGGIGYGIISEHAVARGHAPRVGEKMCYQCCGETDRLDMIAEGKAVLYLTHNKFPMVALHGQAAFARKRLGSIVAGTITNWPGTLKLNCRVKVGAHNIARYRYDAWFKGPDGKDWHGVAYGDNSQLIRCKRLKAS